MKKRKKKSYIWFKRPWITRWKECDLRFEKSQFYQQKKTEFHNCPNASLQQFSASTESPKKMNCLMICSKQVSESTTHSKRRYKKTFALSFVVMRCRRSRTSATQTKSIWEKSWLCSVGKTWNLSRWLRQRQTFSDKSSTQRIRS